MKISITNGRLIDPQHQLDCRTDLHLAAGKVVAIGAAPADFVADETLDASGCIVCPGLIDLSARVSHLESELTAAVAGGVTTVVCPPDMDPPLDEPELAERLVRHAADIGLARVLPLGALTLGLQGERITEMSGLHDAGCIAFNQANVAIKDTLSLRRAMEYAATLDYPVWLKAQDAYLAQDGVAHDGEVASRLGLAGIPVSAETVALHTLLILAQDTGVRLHITRLSSAAGVAVLAAAQAAGQAVTADVGIHHLHLSEMDIGFFDTNARFDPPLRSLRDRDGLSQAAAQGTLSICSNHTPVKPDDKILPFAEAKPGSTALELFLPLLLQWANSAKVSLSDALARVTCQPAQLLGARYAGLGQLGLGAVADVCIFNPDTDWQVSANALHSRGKNTPFLNHLMQGQVQATLVAGKIVFRRKA